MFVGDSLNRGQWISMVCLLQSVIPAEKRSMSPNAHLTVFRAEVMCSSFLFECSFMYVLVVAGHGDVDYRVYYYKCPLLCRIIMPPLNSYGLRYLLIRIPMTL